MSKPIRITSLTTLASLAASAQRLGRLLHMLILCLCCWPAWQVAWAGEWPRLPLPPQVHAFAVGEQITSNGMPMRVQGFVAPGLSVAELAEWYRRQLGQPLVENSLGNKQVLGRAQGPYYLSVQLEPTGLPGQGGSKGLLAVSHVAAMQSGRAQEIEAQKKWLQRWPSGTHILQRMTSQDNGQASEHLVLRNSYSTSLNRETLLSLMQQDDYRLEREIRTDEAELPAQRGRHGGNQAAASVFFFQGQGKQAMATLARDEQGRTAIVLNTTTTVGQGSGSSRPSHRPGLAGFSSALP